MTRSIEITAYENGGAARYASAFHAGLSARERPFLLWNMPDGKKGHALEQTWEGAPLVVLARKNGRIAAAAWTLPASLNSKSAMCHFMILDEARPHAASLGRAFIGFAANCHRHLLALLPAPFFGARTLAKDLGFQPLAIIPSVCWLHAWQRSRPGELLQYTEGNSK